LLRKRVKVSVLRAAPVTRKNETDNINTNIARYKTIILGLENRRHQHLKPRSACFQIDTSSELYYYWLVSMKLTLSLHARKRFL
jgi:hypothetical protein